MKDSENPEFTRRDKVLIAILLLIIVAIAVAIAAIFIKRQLQSQFVPKLEVEELISGNSQDYLPSVADLPSGFVVMEDNPIEFSSGGNFHTRTFTNSDFVLQGREVNVTYIVGITNETTIAQEVLDRLYSGASSMSGILSIEPVSELEKNFSNTDSVKILFAHELTELNTYAISYTVFLRYRNVMTMLVVSAPVDNFDSNYTQQVKDMLGKAVLYYSNLVTRKLPDRIQTNVPQPPFGAAPVLTPVYISPPINSTTTPTLTPVYVQPTATNKTYINVSTGLCLDSNANSAVYTLGCNGGNYQNWESRDESLVNVSTGFCLDSNTEGKVYAISCNGGDYQKWYRSDNRLINVATGLCLDSNANGKVYTLNCNGGNYQNWK